ncbi:GNAT family N-acetyltransferase (plasmid) [Roseibium aggregatum]|nr:GNAT family N-acetyltransferase [Roseibium aggregatum]
MSSPLPTARPRNNEDALKIRPIVPADIPQFFELCREHAAFEGAAITGNDQETRWKSIFFEAPPRLFGWVCDKGGSNNDLFGYMTASIEMATWTASPHVFLDCLYLRSDMRRCGIGKTMMRILSDFAIEQGCEEIHWHSLPSNREAANFYRSLGASQEHKLRWKL